MTGGPSWYWLGKKEFSRAEVAASVQSLNHMEPTLTKLIQRYRFAAPR